MRLHADFSQYSVLVTGCGGVTGQGILQALLALKNRPRLIGTDVSATAAGLFWVDEAILLPHSTDPEAFVDAIETACREFNIAVIFAGSDGEAACLSADDLCAKGDVLLASARKQIWEITGDKLQTYRMAKSLGISTPFTEVFSKRGFEEVADRFGTPVVLKPRVGSGSRGIYYINKWSGLPGILDRNNFLVQQYLGRNSTEYTVGAYFRRTSSKIVPNALVAMRRELLNGNSVFGQIVEPTAFESPISKIGVFLDLSGYNNFQFIRQNDQTYLLEINARFSSSVSMSLRAGCNFVERYLLDNLLGRSKRIFRSEKGLTVVRYMADFVVTQNKFPEVRPIC